MSDHYTIACDAHDKFMSDQTVTNATTAAIECIDLMRGNAHVGKLTKDSEVAAIIQRAINAELTRLRAINGELVEDKRRLDWLERQSNGVMIWRGTLNDGSPICDLHEPREEGYDDACGEELGQGCSLRQAIDASQSPTCGPLGINEQGAV